MTVAMALAETTHHSSRGQKNARAREWGREMNCTATIPETPSPPPPLPHSNRSSSAFTKKSPAGSRLDRLFEVRPQEAVQRHTVEQLSYDAPRVPTLDVPVPQTVDHLVEVFRYFDSEVPEQVIDVPKIILEDIPVRALVRGQQLVDVPVPSPRRCVIKSTLREVVLARWRDTAGREWWQCAGPQGSHWWLVGTRLTQSTLPGETHRQPRAEKKTGQG